MGGGVGGGLLVKCVIAECGMLNAESKNAEMSAERWVKCGMRKGQYARQITEAS